jgi:ribosomal-protein-alanine N-acetyltransferase
VALFTIRPAREMDLARLVELEAASPEAGQWSPEQYKGVIAEGSSLCCWVAEWDGCVEGMIVFRGPVAGESEILNLAVSPEHRRRGIGRALLLAACEQAATFFLEVRRNNHGGIEFYRQCGFREAGRRKDYYRNPPEDAIVMRRAAAAGSPEPSALKNASGSDDAR